MKILITGVQGSGKTVVSRALKELGYNALDTDEISEWINTTTGQPIGVSRTKNSTRQWLSEHAWMFNKEKLTQVISQDKDVLLCGVAKNQEDYYKYFDKIIYLYIDLDTVQKRIATRDTGSFGKHPHERDYILQNAELIYKNAHAPNAVIIDATRPLKKVVDDISALIPTVGA